MPDRLRRFADLRSWLRHLARASVHSGATAVSALLGTNAAENMAPVAFYGLGMDWRQMIAAFVFAAVVAAWRELAADAKAAQDAATAQIAAKEAEKAAAISAVESARDSAIAAKDAEITTLRARVAALEAELTAEKAKQPPAPAPTP